jgi:hypothetical protein
LPGNPTFRRIKLSDHYHKAKSCSLVLWAEKAHFGAVGLLAEEQCSAGDVALGAQSPAHGRGHANVRAVLLAHKLRTRSWFYMKKILGISAVALLATLAPAQAGGVKVGVLTCDVESGLGFIIGSSKGINCEFRNSAGEVEAYEGSIGKLGVDIGYTGRSRLAWLVVAPGQLENDALEGSYGGASAQATIGVGVGANVLVGGFRKSVNLQPISVQGQTGLNVAAGIAALTLRSVN